MKLYCTKCFEEKSKCTHSDTYGIEIDYLIYPSIRELNRKGYKTSVCCSGHEGKMYSFYVGVENMQTIEIVDKPFTFEVKRYRGRETVNKNFIRCEKEYEKSYKKNAKTELEKKKGLVELNYEFYKWVLELPIYKLNNEIYNLEFDYSYFENYFSLNEQNTTYIIVNPNLNVLSSINNVNKKLLLFNANVINDDGNTVEFKTRIQNMSESNLLTYFITNKEKSTITLSDASYEKNTFKALIDDKIWLMTKLCNERNFQSYLFQHQIYKMEMQEDVLTSTIKWFNEFTDNNEEALFTFERDNLLIVLSNKCKFSYYCDRDSVIVSNNTEKIEDSEFNLMIPKTKMYYVFVNSFLISKGEF